MTTFSFSAINKPIARNPVNHISGLIAYRNSDTSVSISSGTCSDSTNNIDMTLDEAIIIDASLIGAGGLDTGTFAANKFYYIHVIGDSSGNYPTSGMFSLSRTAPTLPYGYDSWRMVTIKRTQDGSAVLEVSYTRGKYGDRTFIYGNNKNITLPASGSFPTSYTLLSMDTAIPPADTYTDIEFAAGITPVAPGNGIDLSNNGSNYFASLSGSVASVKQWGDLRCLGFIDSGEVKIYYRLTSATEVAAGLEVKSFTYTV